MRGSREASRIAVRVHGVAARRRAGLASGARTCGAVAAATQQFATEKVVGIEYTATSLRASGTLRVSPQESRQCYTNHPL